MKYIKCFLLLFAIVFSGKTELSAQNPLITNQFTADPTARVFNGRVYVYPSHDILAKPGHGRVGWFCMEDYHVFSSANLTDWTDHGMIVSQTTASWVNPTSYSMWAPDCVYRNGKYYFYFPTTAKDTVNGRGFTIGVALADKPSGPFIPQPEPIKGVRGIDPNVFIDKNGQAYMYWAQGNIYAAKLKENMLELASEPVILGDLPDKGLKEGPYLFERNGIYYLTYPHVDKKTERLEYATSKNPLGPFKFAGVIMDESASGCWTNHQSILEFNKQWYLFYHDNQLSPKFDKARSIRADSLFFNADGSIRKVTPTLRGPGITRAEKEIQIDRYSAISNEGITVNFIDTLNTMKGWKVTMNPNAWVRYNKEDFEKTGIKRVSVNAVSKNATTLEIHADKLNGPLVGRVEVSQSAGWKIAAANNLKNITGVHDLFFVSTGKEPLEVDWVKFSSK
jgi:hypothetical protein